MIRNLRSSSLALPCQILVSVDGCRSLTACGGCAHWARASSRRPAPRTARPGGRAGEYRKARRFWKRSAEGLAFPALSDPRPPWHNGCHGWRVGYGFRAGSAERRIFVRDSEAQPQSSSLALPGQSIVSVTVVGRPASLPARPEGRAGYSRNMKTDREFTVSDLKEITECGSGRTTAMEGMDWQNPSARAQNFHNPNGFPKGFYVPQG